MARIPFQKPKTIHWEILSDRYGRLMAEPFEKGYGQTVGHSLRRTLLSIIPGAAATKYPAALRVAWVGVGASNANASTTRVFVSIIPNVLPQRRWVNRR